MSMKRLILGAASAIGVFALGRRCTGKALRVLAYHGVQDDLDPIINFDGFQVPVAVFREQLAHLVRHYRVITPQEALDVVSGRNPWPDRAVLITFDDGYRNNATVAAPILREFGMSAILFVATGYLDGTHYPWWYQVRELVRTAGTDRVGLPGRPSAGMSPLHCMAAWEHHLKGLSVAERDKQIQGLHERLGVAPMAPVRMMTWDEARSVQAMGMAVAPHTATHPNLGVEPADRALDDIRLSIARVKEEIGYEPRWYSYPYGRATDVASDIPARLKSLGIEAAVTTTSGLNRRGANPYLLRRLNVSGGHRERAFEKLLAVV